MKMDSFREKIHDFVELSFPTISAYQENAAMMHYEATETDFKVLEPKGMLLVDSGGTYHRGTTDVTRTIVIGEISDTMKEHYSKTVAGMLQLADTTFLYGCGGINLDIMARQPLWDLGIDYKCGTGHGIGFVLNVHEGPQSIRPRLLSKKRYPIRGRHDCQ
jgi:Xaa-Pro aminopeptidase